jgi:hypothetical protein
MEPGPSVYADQSHAASQNNKSTQVLRKMLHRKSKQ